MSPSQHRYWRGVLLYSICDWLSVPEESREVASKKIHKALKTAFEIDSFRYLEASQFEKIASIVRMYWLRQYGWIIPEADEEGVDITKMTMMEFLKFKKIL